MDDKPGLGSSNIVCNVWYLYLHIIPGQAILLLSSLLLYGDNLLKFSKASFSGPNKLCQLALDRNSGTCWWTMIKQMNTSGKSTSGKEEKKWNDLLSKNKDNSAKKNILSVWETNRRSQVFAEQTGAILAEISWISLVLKCCHCSDETLL